MQMKAFLMFIALLLGAGMYAQTNERAITAKFFQLFEQDPAQAVDYVYGLNKWIDLKSDAVLNVKGKLNQYRELLGAYQGHEFIAESRLGECFSVYVFLAKYDRQPLRFTFEFYKPKNEWIVYSFQFDDNFDDDMVEMMKLDYLTTKKKE